MRYALFSFMFLSIAPAVGAAEDLKLGYVDVQRALNEVEDGRVAKAALKKEFDEKQRVLDQKQEELKVMKEDLDKQSSLLSNDAKQDRLNELQKKMLEMQQLYMNLQKELSSREGEVTKGIFERMNRVLNQIAEEENYSVILERNESSILFARPHMDLTNELIRKYNAQLAADKKGGKPAGEKKPKKEKKVEGAAP